MDPIKDANSKSLDRFLNDYLPTCSSWQKWSNPITQLVYQITLQTASSLSEVEFDSCFQLIEVTSANDYRNSKIGWKPRVKRTEMRLVDLKYLLVKRGGRVEGFASFMPTHEDEYRVIYCYEIHLSQALQGTGLGSTLMALLDSIGSRIPQSVKVMLTCFTSNTRGLKFYSKIGFVKDENSPPPKQLRNGTKIEADYIILSKSIQR